MIIETEGKPDPKLTSVSEFKDHTEKRIILINYLKKKHKWDLIAVKLGSGIDSDHTIVNINDNGILS